MASKTGSQGGYEFLLPKLSKATRTAQFQLLQPTKPAAKKKPGKRGGNRKLTDEQVVEMRRLWETERANWTAKKLAERYGITPGFVTAIVNYHTRTKAADGSHTL